MGRKIIIIDDSSTVLNQVSQILTEAGYEPIGALDGVDGLEKVRAHRDAALILSDINMPRMDGLDMLDAIARDVGGPMPPIIMLTTEGHSASITRARRAGARGWIVKPFQTDVLLQTVRKIAGPG